MIICRHFVPAYPLVSSFSARIVLLGKVPQVVIVVEVEKLHKVLKWKQNWRIRP